ncbi:MAG: hypothetical protein QF741_04495 [Candidatus Peribacteraceae bacterium]|nr:hypothetical protein [Candidatus Peribacteraceae bacterium]MDP7454823.1 hypothetical protein [Candidatus Peribacteraceae bacterium]MDP7645901.1 hypothetical protein [Candidatus Peribacteraceae bacterium]
MTIPPIFPSGDKFYDYLMSQIEPDLVSDRIPFVARAYTTDTKEERKERAVRYRNAFKEYKKRKLEYVKEAKKKLAEYEREEFAKLKELSAIFDEEKMNAIDFHPDE